MVQITFPSELVQIPKKYFDLSNRPGTLVDLNYSTYESFSYQDKTRVLKKRAVVYLPYNYNEKEKYNVVYLMHGGWSNETTYLGTPDRPHPFKNVLDHALADKKMTPMIVVCPTYNNLSEKDSSDYNLAIELTNNYHHELVNDLMPAVAETFHTYSKDGSKASLKESRDHRAFIGLSMGSVATWRTFQYCLDYFRYFMPSSGSITNNGSLLAEMVRRQKHTWQDFFIFAASGTDDFAFASFTNQIMAMKDEKSGIFKYANNSEDGNLYYLIQEGNEHNLEAAIQYFYNGMIQLWRNKR